jgi:hypothetical protein
MITLQEIENSDFLRVAQAVKTCIDLYKEKRELELIAFGISGYENDSRALFDIPVVRKWSKAMYEAVPYVLDLLDPSTLSWLLPSIADIEILNPTGTTTGWRFREDTREAFIKQSVNIRMKLCNYLAANQQEFDELSDAAFARFKTAIFPAEKPSSIKGRPFVDVYPHSLVVCTTLPASFFSGEEAKHWLIANRNIAIGSFLGMQSKDEVDTFMSKFEVNMFICGDCSMSEIRSGSIDDHAIKLVSGADEFVRSAGITVEKRQYRIVPILCEDAFKKTSWVRYCWFFD